jgi:1-acyl-sn-glycerol-3-phosphate acyltransferase
MGGSGQFQLLRERRFLPYFVTQALAAFNDNLLRTLLALAVTYQAARYGARAPPLLANLVNGLFILPFVLFSGSAGQIAERFDKARILKALKGVELAIAACAAAGFVTHSLTLLGGSLFLMGVHSSFFAPAKYGLLPQVLRPAELIGGNALTETGTFAAILLGTLAAGALALRGSEAQWGMVLIGVAALGLAVSLFIPRSAPAAPQLSLDWNPWRAARDNLRAARAARPVWLALLGISWFWFYGALLVAQLPLYCRYVLNASEQLVTLMLLVLAAALALGALACERLSGRKVEIGLVPFGSIGLTLFALDLAWASPASAAPQLLGVRAFLAQSHAWRILLDLAGLGVFAGLYIVPLYARVQQRAAATELARIMGANNILNAVLIVAAALFGAALAKLGARAPTLLAVVALMNAAVAFYIYSLLPEFLLRFLCWLLVHTIYRVDEQGRANLPERGAALLVCNHVSFVDALVISAACPRPIRFVMESAIFEAPVIHLLARGMKAVPIAPQREDPLVYAHAFQIVAQELRAGQLVCIFPEGRLTSDGEIGPFRPGLMRILAETPVPVVPMALSGLWRSVFSRRPGRLRTLLLQSLAARIGISIGAPVAPAAVTPELLRERVQALRSRP